MYVCGHMYPSVFSLNAKKSGTMDMTPSAKRKGWRKKKTGDDVPKKSKNKGMET